MKQNRNGKLQGANEKQNAFALQEGETILEAIQHHEEEEPHTTKSATARMATVSCCATEEISTSTTRFVGGVGADSCCWEQQGAVHQEEEHVTPAENDENKKETRPAAPTPGTTSRSVAKNAGEQKSSSKSSQEVQPSSSSHLYSRPRRQQQDLEQQQEQSQQHHSTPPLYSFLPYSHPPNWFVPGSACPSFHHHNANQYSYYPSNGGYYLPGQMPFQPAVGVSSHVTHAGAPYFFPPPIHQLMVFPPGPAAAGTVQFPHPQPSAPQIAAGVYACHASPPLFPPPSTALVAHGGEATGLSARGSGRVLVLQPSVGNHNHKYRYPQQEIAPRPATPATASLPTRQHQQSQMQTCSSRASSFFPSSQQQDTIQEKDESEWKQQHGRRSGAAADVCSPSTTTNGTGNSMRHQKNSSLGGGSFTTFSLNSCFSDHQPPDNYHHHVPLAGVADAGVTGCTASRTTIMSNTTNGIKRHRPGDKSSKKSSSQSSRLQENAPQNPVGFATVVTAATFVNAPPPPAPGALLVREGKSPPLPQHQQLQGFHSPCSHEASRNDTTTNTPEMERWLEDLNPMRNSQKQPFSKTNKQECGLEEQRRIKKNYASRCRAKKQKQRIEQIKNKPFDQRTAKEQHDLRLYEERRRNKNERSRLRSSKRKALVDVILTKSEAERTKAEAAILHEAAVAMERKNKADRLRREQRVKPQAVLQQPCHPTSTCPRIGSWSHDRDGGGVHKEKPNNDDERDRTTPVVVPANAALPKVGDSMERSTSIPKEDESCRDYNGTNGAATAGGAEGSPRNCVYTDANTSMKLDRDQNNSSVEGSSFSSLRGSMLMESGSYTASPSSMSPLIHHHPAEDQQDHEPFESDKNVFQFS
ncbi:hypothetical protein ACA910_018850 [Epithemia clementina (nom. ined.)]